MCARWITDGPPPLDEFRGLVTAALSRLESVSRVRFGDTHTPLLVSVRSGAPASMPGMLDTVLNVGLTSSTMAGLIEMTGNPHLAWDCYLRLIESYAGAVRSIEARVFRDTAAKKLKALGTTTLRDLDTLALRGMVSDYLDVYADAAGEPFPQDPFAQLLAAIDAVFRSWNSARARSYRRINRLEGLPGTAVAVQRMVFGNAGPRSGAGVGFTRDPATGDRRLYLDFAFDAQGEDVVSGRCPVAGTNDIERLLPDVARALEHLAERLEQVFRDAQDFEFTVEEGVLWLLQTRDAKRSNWAGLRIAIDLAREELITREEALRRVTDLDLAHLARRSLAGANGTPIASGVAAGIGVVAGAVVFSVEAAREEARLGRRVILVRDDIATDDIDGIMSAEGVLTARGGRTSHAAVVAREFGKVAIVGCPALAFSADGKSCVIGGRRLSSGDIITLDGDSGHVYVGAMSVVETRPEAELLLIETWKKATTIQPA
ncbi:MAG: pyruvate, phosphate dikinase [Alphaproteobacteria bacterium]|nr:pyruvate, phosphate dikinase [Alphaproteobacteria bacterium]MBL7099577.1 pyruvate, phosphate dikinase [Alphaproteobacteria bacterium]